MYQTLRGFFVSTCFATPVDLHGKMVIVTGASPNSIGFETAKTLAQWGARVIVTARREVDASVAQLRTASGGAVQGHALDLTNTESVKQFANWFLCEQGDKLDVLVNNAGIHLDLRSQWQQPQLTADGFEIHWRTNYLGTMQLTQLLLPALLNVAKQTGDARIVNVVSMLHRRGRNQYFFEIAPHYNSWNAYGQSKLALVHATLELQRRYSALGLQAYCLHPGAVFTNIASKGLANSPRLSALRDKFSAVEAFFLLTPEEGAQTQLHCATAPALAGGRYFNSCAPEAPSAESADAAVAARLWEQTQQWLGSL